MTTDLFILDLIQLDEGETEPPRVRLAVRAFPSDAKGFVSLTPECNTMEEFEQAVKELRKNMDAVLQRAKETFQQSQTQIEKGTLVTESQSLEEIWQALEECASIEEMREIFNTLSLQKRQEVANFVLTQLNIFKGAASTFSQHYNEGEYLLE